MVARLLARLVGRHLGTALDALLHNPLSRILHRLEHFLFFSLSEVLVKLSAPLILALTKLPILADHLFALICAPNFVV